MAPGYDVDDSASHFGRSGNGNASKAIFTESTDDEILSRILPRVDTSAIDAARIAIGQDSEDSDGEPVRPLLRRSLSASSIMIGAVINRPESLKDTALERTEDPFRHERDGAESIHHSRPQSRADRIPHDFSPRSYARSDRDTVAVPNRHSSRPDRASTGNPDQIDRRRDYNSPQRHPRAAEIEAARKLLAQVAEDEEYSHRGVNPPREVRSATPPPIGRPRRIIYSSDDDEDDKNEVDHEYHEYRNEIRKERPRITSTPVTAIHRPAEETSRPAAVHRQSSRGRPSTSRASSRQSSQPPPRSRTAVSLAAQKRDLRTPVLDNHSFYQDAEPPPISQRRQDYPRSRRATYHPHAMMDGEAAQDYSVKNGVVTTLAPDYRPSTTGKKAMSEDSMSISKQSTSKHSITTNGSSRTSVDFFGPSIFQVVLHNPTTVHQLLKFSEARFCSESVEFLKKVSSAQGQCTFVARLLIISNRAG